VSTGKEANVYYAHREKNEVYETEADYAIKIFKTSILIFKDRERYVTGEFRFRKGHCKGNPRKMVKMWAEKEVRNLKRILHSGIKCPNPVILKGNIIVMEFIGKDGLAAPRLRDAKITDWEKCYFDVVKIMRKMY
jgi:RIO kinase 1